MTLERCVSCGKNLFPGQISRCGDEACRVPSSAPEPATYTDTAGNVYALTSYGVNEPREPVGLAQDRRRRVEQERARVACSHPSVPAELPIGGCPDCGLTREELTAMKKEAGAGVGGWNAIDKRVAAVHGLAKELDRASVPRYPRHVQSLAGESRTERRVEFYEQGQPWEGEDT